MSKKLTLLSSTLLIGSMALAQKDSSKTPLLDEVVVTATKAPKKLSETGKVVTVINRQQIERSGGKDLAQLLNEQTGLSINGANSNPGKDKSVFLRGASPNYTVILLDGVPLSDPSGLGGAYDLRLLPMSQVERIEILKGSQSTLYGSNAIAGVINIITRKATSNQTQGSGLVSYGSYNTMKGNADFNKRGKIFEYDVNYQYLSTDGIAEAKDTLGTKNFPKNGFTQNGFQANLGFNVNQHFKISPYYRYTEFKGTYSNGAFSGGNNPYSAVLNNTGLIANYNYAKGTISANYGYDFTNRTYSFGTYLGRFHHAEALISHTFNENVQFIGGASFQSFSIVTSDTTNSLISPYATALFSFGGLHIEAGGRFNHHNRFGNNLTYSLNPSYLINKNLKVFANLSSGFRAPSLSEMLPTAYSIANTNLTPEKSVNIEAGFQTWLVQKTVSLMATYFNRNLTNAIIYYTDPVTYKSQYINRDKQHDQGVEVELNYQPTSRLTFKGSYTYVYGEGTQKLSSTKDTTFYNLIRRPKNTINLFVGYQLTKNLFVSTSLQSFGKRTDNSYNPVTYVPYTVNLKAYALWNLYAEYKILNNNLSFFADAKNLTNNKDYYEAYGYSVQGFTLNGGIRFKL